MLSNHLILNSIQTQGESSKVNANGRKTGDYLQAIMLTVLIQICRQIDIALL